MLDEIYLRLLLELIPTSLKLNSLDVRRIIEQFSDSSRSRRAYGELIKHVYSDEPDSDIGLQFGIHLHPSTLCDLSRTLMTAPDFQSAIQLVERFHYIHGASYFPVISKTPGKLSIALTFPFKSRISKYQRRFCAESVFSYALNALRETVSPNISPTAIYFDYPSPVYSDRYPSQFSCPPIFDAPLSVIEFDDQLLFRDVTTQNPTLHQLYMNKSLDMWRQSERLQDFEYRVITYIMLHHPESFNSQKLASKLNISVRGLQKRLSKQGESFSHLANLARKELAKVYLFQKHLGVEFTAEQLGFQTISGFRRFFKSEFGQTPSELMAQFAESENRLQ